MNKQPRPHLRHLQQGCLGPSSPLGSVPGQGGREEEGIDGLIIIAWANELGLRSKTANRRMQRDRDVSGHDDLEEPAAD